jgi:hypothetical protein
VLFFLTRALLKNGNGGGYEGNLFSAIFKVQLSILLSSGSES